MYYSRFLTQIAFLAGIGPNWFIKGDFCKAKLSDMPYLHI